VEAPKQAAKEIAAGRPGETARRVLGPTILIVIVLFAIDTYLVVNQSLTMAFDLPVTLFIQKLPWGPVVYPMELINWTAGSIQVVAGALAIVGLFLFERRAGYLMLIGSVGSLIDNIIKVVVSRQRPPADLVEILTPASGFSYPSGHAVFFTWLSFMVAFAIAPRVKPRYRFLLWLAAAVVIALACLARVWAGDHWPSDVFGGCLLGLGWSAFALWLPERWLPSPKWRWFQGRERAKAA
jgi:undecaprenyl-diphosphatase